MIEKINSLKSITKNTMVKSLCEKILSTLNESVYQNIPAEARIELEKALIKKLFENLSKETEPETRKWLKNTKRIWSVRNLGVRDAINSLRANEGKENASLRQSLEFFREQLESEPEVLIYESFISAMQSFNYFPQVGNAIKAIKDRVDTYESDVSITKIMETMKKSKSHYLVPLIEDLVQNYLDSKNEQTKSSLKEGLIKFSYDPFVRDIINLVTADATELQLEYANSQCNIEKVYSPILYIGENEAIFAVKESYYIKKGTTIFRLKNDSIKKLDQKFVSLCEAINSPNIVIKDKSISIYEGSDKAIITENSILLNGQEFTNDDLKNSMNIAQWTGKERFLSLVEMMKNNFNEIAEVDFAKRVFLKENMDYAADVFKLRDNISIATFNPMMGKGTFYRNINPMQAKNLMMEHLRFDVATAFDGLLPNDAKINEEIAETRNEYASYISDLENKILEFKSSSFNKKINEEVFIALEEELTEIKSEYRDYLNLVESYTRIPKADINESKISLNISGPLEIEVNGQKYTVPIPGSTGNDGQNHSEFGTEVGGEDVSDEPASAITFGDTDSELLGDSPSVQADEINLGADELETDVDAAEAEKDIEKDVEDDTEDNIDTLGAEGDEQEGNADVEGSGEDEIKIGDTEDLGISDDEPADIESDENNTDKKIEKVEDSTSNSKPKKRVYLKKKKS